MDKDKSAQGSGSGGGKKDEAQLAKAALAAGNTLVAQSESEYPGASCTTADGRSGYLISCGNQLICTPNDEA